MNDELTLEEAVKLGAIDPVFYSHYFFPKAARQTTPEIHKEMWELIDNPAYQYVGLMVFRDGAKTTLCRLNLSRRIAYGISRTIVVVGKSESHAMKTIDWLQRAILFNRPWANAFGLKKGKQWSGSEIDIENSSLGISIRIVGMGITGSTRGINIDDYRPDLIFVDDPCDEENTATPEQRMKIEELFFGSLYNSLAPRSDSPESKMVLAQTVLDEDDLISQVCRDDTWATAIYSCFDENGESAWPERYPTEVLMKEKQSFINRNQLSLWLREKECVVVSGELSYFKADWLRYYDIAPEGGFTLIGVDPTPPPKDGQSQIKQSAKLDDAVILAIKIYKGDVYLLDYYTTKSPDPEEFLAKLFEYHLRFKPMKVGIETHLFQRVVKANAERKMQELRYYFPITACEDKRPKPVRINQTVANRASQRKIHVKKIHAGFIEQYTKYPVVKHDDILDAFSIALSLTTPALENMDFIDGEFERLDDKPLDGWRNAP